jgi:hypothetical protein
MLEIRIVKGPMGCVFSPERKPRKSVKKEPSLVAPEEPEEMSPEMVKLLEDLKQYCNEKRGRRAEVTRKLGISFSAFGIFCRRNKSQRGARRSRFWRY